ncbi:MAG: hypothetical protein Q7T11_07090 [Deltaproteobacteria bacterium]|nr:hypothetical protein [Deltaproteobacteria bacterium]
MGPGFPLTTAGMTNTRKLFRQSHFFLWFPVVAFYGVIFYLSSLSSSEIHLDLGQLDKLIHFLEFGLFGALSARALFWEGLYHRIS